MRTIVLLAVAALAGSPLFADAAAASTTEILQQRTSDGRILLTDRPSAGAKTERSWRMETEDPAAARRRALDVQVESQLVSERIERRIAQQQRTLDEEMQRRSMALERDRAITYGDDPYADGLVVFAPGRLFGPQRHHGSRFDGRPGRDGRSPGAPRMSRMSRFTGPAGLGSR
jgi:hypothetical protein